MNKQCIWIRMRALEHFVIMANTCNSMMIREYFLDLKRIMTEYNMYQAVYRSTLALCIKDTRIDELIVKMDQQNTKIDVQTEQLSMQTEQLSMQTEQLSMQTEQLSLQAQKLDMLARILHKETDNKVVDVQEKQKQQGLVVLRNKTEPTKIEVLRGQKAHVNQQLKRKGNDMEVVGKIDSYKNPINLLNRFNETIKKDSDERFSKSSNKIVLKNGSTAEDLMHVFKHLEEDKHNVANEVKKCL